MQQLTNKTVLITGGASGIGKIMARLMLERQANVIIWDINQASIDTTIAEFADKAHCRFQCRRYRSSPSASNSSRSQRNLGYG